MRIPLFKHSRTCGHSSLSMTRSYSIAMSAPSLLALSYLPPFAKRCSAHCTSPSTTGTKRRCAALHNVSNGRASAVTSPHSRKHAKYAYVIAPPTRYHARRLVTCQPISHSARSTSTF